MSQSRIAVIGLGNAGYTLHLPALAGLAKSATVVAACDPLPERRSRAAEAFKVPVVATFEEALATSPDVVIVCTPPESHLEYCTRAMESGANVICEKPFVSSVDDANKLIDVAQRSGRRIALNHEFREMPIFRSLLDEARRSRDGVIFAHIWQLMDLPPWAEPGWRGQMLTRTLYEAGIHLVDFAMALFGERPAAVSATTSTCGVREEESDAVALVTLEFSRGRLAQIVQNRLCKGETQYFEVRAELPDSSLRASFGGRARISAGLHRSTKPHVRLEYGVAGLAWRETGHSRTLLMRNPKDPAMVATRLLLERTLEGFRNGTAVPADAVAGRDALEVLAACYEAASTGCRVVLSDAGSNLSSLALA